MSGAPTRRALLGAAAALAVAAPAYAQGGRSDGEILEELIALEARLAGAYEAALQRDAIDSGLGELLLEARAHPRSRTGAPLGGRPRAACQRTVAQLASALRSPAAFARFALDLEAQAVAAYVGVGRNPEPGLRRPARLDHGLRVGPRGRSAGGRGAAIAGGHAQTR